MADRKNFFFEQRVSQAEIDDAFADTESAEFKLKVDAFAGVGFLMALASVAEDSPQSTSVLVGSVLGWDNLGQSVDKATSGTAFSFAGDDDPALVTPARLYIKFARVLSDPRTDGNGFTVNFESEESFVLERDLGTPGGALPALRVDESIQIATVNIPAAAGVIPNANITADATTQNLQSSFNVARLEGMTQGMEDAAVAAAAATPSTANRLALLSDVGTLADGFISNVKIVTTGATMPTDTVDVERATAVNGGATPDTLMNVTNAPIDLGAAVGVGALDVGVVANATYYVYLVGDSTGVTAANVVASLDAGPGFGGVGPSFANMPLHDRFRLIGVIIRAAGEIIPFRQIGNVTIFDDTIKTAAFGPGADPHVGGGPGVGSGFIALSLAPYVPAIAERAFLRATVLVSTATVPHYHFRSKGGPAFIPATDYTNDVFSGESAAAGQHHHSESHFPIHVDVAQAVDWERSETATAATVGVHVTGFEADYHHD